MVKLDNRQQKRLNDALKKAFPTNNDLKRMVYYGIGENLEEITSGNLENTILDLMRWAISKGRIEDLVDKAREYNDTNPELLEFYQEVWKPLADAEITVLTEQLVVDSRKVILPQERIVHSPLKDETIALYYSYADEDIDLLTLLQKQLIMLRRSGLLTIWHRGEIQAGEHADAERVRHLNNAHIILLLVSPHFLASEHTYDEAMRAMQLHESTGVVVIPIIGRPTADWQHTTFGRLQALPKTEKAITEYFGAQREKLLKEIATSIRNIVEGLRVKQI